MKSGLVLFAAAAVLSQSVLAGTITLSGYEYLNTPIEVASYAQPVGTVEITSGGFVDLGGIFSSRATIPRFGGTVEVLALQPISPGSGVLEGAIVPSIHLSAGLEDRLDDYLDATPFVAEANSSYAGIRRRLKGPDVFHPGKNNFSDSSQLPVGTVPEPSSIALFSAGLIVVLCSRRRINRWQCSGKAKIY